MLLLLNVTAAVLIVAGIGSIISCGRSKAHDDITITGSDTGVK